MACCTCGDKKEDEAKNKGIIMERSCRDVLCLILFVLFWGGMWAIAGVAIASGDFHRLLYGVDYKGNTCGTGSLANTKRIVYPRLNADLLLNMQKGNLINNPLAFKLYGVCVAKCPVAKDVICNYDLPAAAAALTATQRQDCFTPANANKGQCPTIQDYCWIIPQNTSSVLYRCLPEFVVNQAASSVCIFPAGVTDPRDPACAVKRDITTDTIEHPAQSNLVYDQLNQAQSLWGQWIGDVQRSWWVITICGVVLALIISFIWVLLMKWCTGIMVFLSVVAVIAVSIALTLFCYWKAGILTNEQIQTVLGQAGVKTGTVTVPAQIVDSTQNTLKFKYAAFFFTAVTVLILLVLMAVRKSLVAAVHIIRAASRALQAHPLIVLYPIVTVVALFALLMYFVFIGAELFSAGKVVDVTGIKSTLTSNIQALNQSVSTSGYNLTRLEGQALKVLDQAANTRYLFIYHFFGLLWTNQVIQGIGMMVMATVFSTWYFSQGLSTEESQAFSLGRFPILAALRRTMRYHFGSICFGGLLIAILQFIRAVFEYVRRNYTKKAEENNYLVKLAMMCIACCMYIIETCLKYITRTAYIYIAVKGTGYASAALHAIGLMVTNLSDIAVVNTISEVLLFMGRIFVSGVSAFFCFWFLDTLPQFQEGGADELVSSWLPVLVTLIFAFFVSSAFFYVFDMAVDTILLCFCMDRNENNGNAIHMQPHEIIHNHKPMAEQDNTL